MSDVFALTSASRSFFAAAARRAAVELGLFSALPCSDQELAERLGLPSPRLRPLVRALRKEGLLDPAAALSAAARVSDEGWGRLGEVIRRDRPLDTTAYTCSWHEHLSQAGEAAAKELAPWLFELDSSHTLLDLGGGLGTYARPFAALGGRATVVDRSEIVAQAKSAAGVTFVADDIFHTDLDGFGVVLLSNVLHLYGAHECAQLCMRARQLGHSVVVKDFDLASSAGTWFAVNMALYTEAGDVHDSAQIAEWLGGAEIKSLGDHVLIWK